MTRMHTLDRTTDTVAMAQEVLHQTVSLLMEMGCSRRELLAALNGVGRRRRGTNGVGHPYSATQVAEVLARWHSHPDYVEASGHPRSLSLSGRHSLSSLIRDVTGVRDVRGVVRVLVQSRSIRLRGTRYRPAQRFVSIAETAPLAHAQSLTSIRGLLQTVQHNVRTSKPIGRLLERKAANLTIPVRLLPAVHRRIKRQAQVFLETMDAELGESAVPPGTEPTTGVHLVTFVFEDPFVSGRPGRRVRR